MEDKRPKRQSAAKSASPKKAPRTAKVAPKKESSEAASSRKSKVSAAPRPVRKKSENKTPFWAPFAKQEAPKPEPQEERPSRRSGPRRETPQTERPVRNSPRREVPPQVERPVRSSRLPKTDAPQERTEGRRFSKPQSRDASSMPAQPAKPVKLEEPMRLNKYLSHCGIAARRQSAEFVKQGLVTVNGEVEPNPGYPVKPGDEVRYKGQVVKLEDRKVYILMNKPRDIITTASDEKGRKTVLDIIGNKVEERIFPVGRLDRNTSGLLLLTNDGDLAKKLSHPSHKVQKVYHVTLDKAFHRNDFEKVQKGLKLEDGLAMVDSLHYVEGTKDELEISLHIGKNRIVRRIFEHLGYEVIKLDRTYYAGLTKKDIGRGHFRHLTEQEVIMLKHFK